MVRQGSRIIIARHAIEREGLWIRVEVEGDGQHATWGAFYVCIIHKNCVILIIIMIMIMTKIIK